MTEKEKLMYALYQANGPVYGVGDTVSACVEAGAYWLEEVPEHIVYEDRGTGSARGEVAGQLYMRKATERLMIAVEEYGGDLRYDMNPEGWLDLDEEQYA